MSLGVRSLVCTANLLVFALAGCGNDSAAPGAGGVGGSGSGGSGGSGGGSGGTGGSAGTSACDPLVVPTLITSLPGASFPAPGDYQAPSAPQLDLDAPDPGFTWNDPHVLKVGAEYWMYASATLNFDFPVRLYRLTSPDGVSWSRNPPQPILEPGSAGSWDAGGVETPAVVFFDDRFHLFYTGYPKEVDDPAHSVLGYRVGHATSCDGQTWTRVGSVPVVSPSGMDASPANDWYGFVVAEPGPVVFDDQLLLYFTALGVDGSAGTSLQVIGVMATSDGVNWSEPELALKPDQTQYPRVLDPGPPLDGWVGYSTPNAIALNGEVHLFVDVAYDPDEMSWQQVRLHHAKSSDGHGGWQQDEAPLFQTGTLNWAVAEVRSPHALIDETTLRLYFAGHELDAVQPNHFAIGMLTASLAGP